MGKKQLCIRLKKLSSLEHCFPTSHYQLFKTIKSSNRDENLVCVTIGVGAQGNNSEQKFLLTSEGLQSSQQHRH